MRSSAARAARCGLGWGTEPSADVDRLKGVIEQRVLHLKRP